MPKDFGRNINIGKPYPPDQEIADTFSNRLEAVIALVDAVEPTQVSIREAQELIKTFVDSLEPTQAAMQETQTVIRAAQDAIQNAQVIADSKQDATHEGQVVTHDKQFEMKTKMDKTLLPLTGEEIPGQDNPILLSDFPQYIYWNESDHPFHFGGGELCRDSGSWLNGEEVIVTIDASCDGFWKCIWDEKFSEESDIERKKIPDMFNDGAGLRIGIRQKVEGDGYHLWSYSFISAEREGGG